MKKKKCISCGSRLPKNAMFCPLCGASQDAGSTSPFASPQSGYGSSFGGSSQSEPFASPQSGGQGGYGTGGYGSSDTGGFGTGGFGSSDEGGYGTGGFGSSFGSSGFNGPAGGSPCSAAAKKNRIRRICLFAGLGILLAALIAASVLLLSRGRGKTGSLGEKIALGKPAVNTAGVLGSAVNSLQLAGFDNLTDDDRCSGSLRIGLCSIGENSGMSGLGTELLFGIDEDRKKAYVSFAPYLGDADILRLNLSAENRQLYLGSEQLLDGRYLNMDASELGNALAQLLDREELRTVQLSLFSSADGFFDGIEGKYDLDLDFDADDLTEALAEDMQIASLGSETVSVFGADVQTEKFEVVLSSKEVREAAMQAADTLAALRGDREKLRGSFRNALRQSGLSAFIGKDTEASALETLDELLAALENALRNMRTNKLYVYSDGSYVRLLECPASPEGPGFRLELGSGGSIADALRITAELPGSVRLQLTSRGNHNASKAAYTDVSTLVLLSDEAGADALELLRMETQLDVKKGDFSMALHFAEDELALQAVGSLKTKKSSFVLADTRLICSAGGRERCSLDLNLSMENSFKQPFTVDKAGSLNCAGMNASDWSSLRKQFQSELSGLLGLPGIPSAAALFGLDSGSSGIPGITTIPGLTEILDGFDLQDALNKSGLSELWNSAGLNSGGSGNSDGSSGSGGLLPGGLNLKDLF